ncbi:MAG: NlpC/P60 family protein [Flavobacteriales bacterium]
MLKTLYTTPLAAIAMRAEPNHKSEMVNQMLMGETAELLAEKDKWCMIQLTHDSYQGWVDRKQIEVAQVHENLRLVTSFFHEKDDGYIAPCGAYTQLPFDSNPLELIETAEMFMSTPYLWGGRTFMGIDCSGLTQIVFRTAGKSLPRDAWQQAECGITISFIDEAQPGDLAFFDNADGRITHVAIIVKRADDGSHQVIHASGSVRKDMLDHQGIFDKVSKTYTHPLRVIKRF